MLEALLSKAVEGYMSVSVFRIVGALGMHEVWKGLSSTLLVVVGDPRRDQLAHPSGDRPVRRLGDRGQFLVLRGLGDEDATVPYASPPSVSCPPCLKGHLHMKK